jgi:hypothetical protein
MYWGNKSDFEKIPHVITDNLLVISINHIIRLSYCAVIKYTTYK